MKLKRTIGLSLLCSLIVSNISPNTTKAEDNVTNKDLFSVVKEEPVIVEKYSLVTEKESVLPEEVTRTKAITTEDLKLRKSADIKSDVITIIPKNSEITVTFSGDKWADIVFEEKEGTVATEYIAKEEIKIENREVKITEGTTEEKTNVVVGLANPILDSNSVVNLIKEPIKVQEIVETKIEEVAKETVKETVVETPVSKPVEVAKKEPVKEVVKEAPKPVEYKTVTLYTTTELNVRSEKSTSSNIITTLAKGTQVTGKDQDDWVQISTSGRMGYVMKQYLSSTKPVIEQKSVEKKVDTSTPISPISNSNSIENMIQFAMNQIGKPYSFASADPSKGFDCSGLTYYAFKQIGYTLSRTAASQYGYGISIPRNQIQRGDLLFFANGGEINHVGIYIGNGKMVHASTYDTGVIVSDISIGYYVNNYVGAKRILK